MLQAGEEDVVIEIGPGKGILTDFLIERYPKLELVEIDPEAAGYLRQHYADRCPPIHQQDILKWNLAEQVPTDSYFISNLPYNISSPIMFAFFGESGSRAGRRFYGSKRGSASHLLPAGQQAVRHPERPHRSLL
jgi:16S rRNA A1518/A1519 N6-dimethyltransferase RsmA/KsgA/DIM1 with predicted DNA glycosylase/AP lyase activity